MTLQSILEELQAMGSESIKKVLRNHGAKEPFWGVKVGDMKSIVKRVKKDHAMSLQLYDTGNTDAMYLAGLIADEKQISKVDLQHWVEKAYWNMLSEYTVPWVAAESPHGWELALEWIESDQENIASSGWSTLSDWISIRPDDKLDIPALSKLLDRVAANIDNAPNRVRYTMNGFVISVGSYVMPLTEKAIDTANIIGKVSVFMGDTACKVPDAVSYIRKVTEMGRLGQKKKMARC